MLIPTYRRPGALAITLTSLCAQSFRDFRVVISDQTEDEDPLEAREVLTIDHREADAPYVLGSALHGERQTT